MKLKLKEKIKNYGFWISLISSVILLVQAFGVKIDVPYINEIVTAILGVFVTLGIISDPSTGSGYLDEDKKNKQENE